MLTSMKTIRDWLRQVEKHQKDTRWLSRNEAELQAAVAASIYRQSDFHDAVELLLRVFNHYALVLYHAKRWSPLLLQALTQAQDLRDSEMQTRILTHMGESYIAGGKNTAAREAFNIALERAHDGQMKEMMLASYIGLIRMLSINVPDDFNAELFSKALDLSSQVNDLSLKASLHQSLTMPYMYARQSVKAVEHGQLAYIYWQYLGNSIEAAKTLYLLASAYRFAWNLERAEQMLEIAASFFETTAYNRQYPLIAYEEGALHIQRKNYDIAEQCLKLALQEAIESGSLYLIASSQHALAIAQTELNQYEAAENNLRQGFMLWENLGDDYELASAHQAMGRLENKRGNPKSAYKWLQASLLLCEKLPLNGEREWLTNHIQATIAEIPW